MGILSFVNDIILINSAKLCSELYVHVQRPSLWQLALWLEHWLHWILSNKIPLVSMTMWLEPGFIRLPVTATCWRVNSKWVVLIQFKDSVIGRKEGESAGYKNNIYRSSNTAWLKDEEDEIIEALSRRIGAILNLDHSTAEPFQVRMWIIN